MMMIPTTTRLLNILSNIIISSSSTVLPEPMKLCSYNGYECDDDGDAIMTTIIDDDPMMTSFPLPMTMTNNNKKTPPPKISKKMITSTRMMVAEQVDRRSDFKSTVDGNKKRSDRHATTKKIRSDYRAAKIAARRRQIPSPIMEYQEDDPIMDDLVHMMGQMSVKEDPMYSLVKSMGGLSLSP